MVSCKAVNGPTLRIRWRLLSLYDNPPSGRNTSQIKRNYLCRSWAIPPSRTAVMTPHTSPVNLHFLQREDREKTKFFDSSSSPFHLCSVWQFYKKKKIALKKSRSWKPIGKHNLNSLSGHIFFSVPRKWFLGGVILVLFEIQIRFTPAHVLPFSGRRSTRQMWHVPRKWPRMVVRNGIFVLLGLFECFSNFFWLLHYF